MQIYAEQSNFKTQCHTVTEPNIAISHACIFASYCHHPPSSHIPLQNKVGYSLMYQKLINSSYTG